MKYKILVKGSIRVIEETELLEIMAHEVKDKSFVGLVIDRADGKGTVVVKRKGGCGKRI